MINENRIAAGCAIGRYRAVFAAHLVSAGVLRGGLEPITMKCFERLIALCGIK